MIELRHITKTFRLKNREIAALSNVSLRVAPGKIFGIIGSSGAGKSTLIRCINLLERPDTGDIIVNGKTLNKLNNKQLNIERRQIGMIFQHFNLLSSRTVFANVALPLELAGENKEAINTRVNELLKLVGLEDKSQEYPSKLSGGQKQRVAIARTLANNPKVLLCDEATSALDPTTTQSILNLLKDINKRLSITILLITHQMEVVKSICDEVAVISEGKLIEQGPLSAIFTSPQQSITKQFIASSLQIEIPTIFKDKLRNEHFEGGNPLLRITIKGDSATAPLLSELTRQFDMDIRIVGAKLDHIGDTNFGMMLIELSGKRESQEDAITYLNKEALKTEIIGYV